MPLDWHKAPLSHATALDTGYKNTQNVRRFMRLHCGAEFKFDRAFMAWIASGQPRTLGDMVEHWLQQHGRSQP
ncbi:DUF6434 domain-containing protein [Pseudomonas sp. 5P_3.1_Bac2]|uniref:DUF6434 domain-containing protein n=1 Tax=Pseudomonas sp. 5P_3.1_Bac2 TaxID=2971617 RepID=UPI0021C9AF62|nr:DUF6434 domain-containing protein [Pseudomonas sp. 5P_3.1_Bac2]MCU1715547.1 DUF6434 domain-containing protein [Pseudomonas sp. 5P_3.1_Bac2]